MAMPTNSNMTGAAASQAPSPKIPPDPKQQGWTVEETARSLSASTKTIRRLIADGRLESFRVGRLLRVRPTDVALYIAKQIKPKRGQKAG
jgi:excisionase family DNA binding protein